MPCGEVWYTGTTCLRYKEGNKTEKQFGHDGAEQFKEDYVLKNGSGFNQKDDSKTGEIGIAPGRRFGTFGNRETGKNTKNGCCLNKPKRVDQEVTSCLTILRATIRLYL